MTGWGIVLAALVVNAVAYLRARGARKSDLPRTPPADPRSDPPTRPVPNAWRTRPSIHGWLQRQVSMDPAGDSSAELGLPDDDINPCDSEDACCRYHLREMIVSGEDADDDAGLAATPVVARIRAALEAPTPANVDALYAAFNARPVRGYAAELQRRLSSAHGIDPAGLHNLAVTLARHAADREPVKAAILLLGMLRGYDDRQLLLLFAVHDEFSPYVEAALKVRRSDDSPALEPVVLSRGMRLPNEEWDGAAQPSDQRIARWILRRGFALASRCIDTIYDPDGHDRCEQLAWEYFCDCAQDLPFCAEAGRLHEHLSAETIDRTLLVGAGDLLEVQITAGEPASYPHEDVVEAYLVQVRRHPEAPEPYCALKAIRHSLNRPEPGRVAVTQPDWAAERRARLLAECTTLLERPGWRERVSEGLVAPPGASRRACMRAASFADLKLPSPRVVK